MASILEQRVEEARGLCVLRSENRHFVVALTWSLGRICATDWILKYTPTASRLIQTTDTIHKRLKLDAQCLARDYATSDVFSTQELLPYLQGPRDVISVLETQKVSKNKLLGLEPSKSSIYWWAYAGENIFSSSPSKSFPRCMSTIGCGV
jgi:hypothetical protein